MPGIGVGNITNALLFVDTNGWAELHLQPNSPCLNAGNNAYVASDTDPDGNPRVIGGTADMDAYEFQSPQSEISYACLQQYGPPTDGSAGYAHSDAHSHNSCQGWKAGTNPTDELSVLRLLTPQLTIDGMVVSWESVTGKRYLFERAASAGGPFSVLQSNIVGEAGTTSFADTNAWVETPSITACASINDRS